MAVFLLAVAATWVCIQAFFLAWKRIFHVNSITVGWFTVGLRTALFNRPIYNYGRHYQTLLRQWFSAGAWMAAMLALSSCMVLFQELRKIAAWTSQMWEGQDGRGEGLQMAGAPNGLSLAIPGVTIPWSHGLYLWLAAILSISVHEVGHAVAAAAEGVGLHYMAVFVLVFLPGALVALDIDTLNLLSPSRKLRVVCGGVWHNVVLSGGCWLLALLLPFLLWPAYSSGHGAVLRGVAAEGPLAGHLAPRDVVTGINSCPVLSAADLVACLSPPSRSGGARGGKVGTLGGAGTVSSTISSSSSSSSSSNSPLTEEAFMKLMARPSLQSGYCVPLQALRDSPACLADGISSSCGEAQLCFHELGVDGRLEGGGSPLGRCLEGRAAVGYAACDGQALLCPPSSLCLQPALPHGESLFKVCFQPGPEHKGLGHARARPGLRRRQVLSASDDGPLVKEKSGAEAHVLCGEYVLFLGSEGALLRALELTDYLPKFFFVPLWLPHFLELFLAYTFSVSAAIALVNMAPVYHLDGDAALEAALELARPEGELPHVNHMGQIIKRRDSESPILSRRQAIAIHRWVLRIGTAVFATVLAAHVLRVSSLDAVLTLWLRRLHSAIKFLFRGRD
eukprot:jgi/Botrbrau1/7971/Bobra.9_2s0122.1